MKKFTIIFTLFAVGLLVQISSAQDKQTLDKISFVKATRLLEQDPFIKDAKKFREVMTYYLIETKDVSLVLCTNDATKTIFDKKYKFSSELFAQNMFGMAAFKLENPDKVKDENAARLAGLESMLKVYEAMVKSNPKAKFAVADDLIIKRDNGTLAKLAADANCDKK